MHQNLIDADSNSGSELRCEPSGKFLTALGLGFLARNMGLMLRTVHMLFARTWYR